MRAPYRHRKEQGSGLVEFALIFPMILLFILLTIDLGRLLYDHVTLQSAVSEATRFGITGRRLADPDNPDARLSRSRSIRAVIDQFAIGLDRGALEVRMEQRDNGPDPIPIDEGGRLATLDITVRYPYQPFITRLLGLGDYTLTLLGRSVMRNEQFPEERSGS